MKQHRNTGLRSLKFRILTLSAIPLLGTLVLSSPAFAHTPTVAASCGGLTASFADYPGINHVTITIDGTTLVHDFTGSANYNTAWDDTTSHQWSVVVDAADDAFDQAYSGVQVACEAGPPDPTTTSTAAPDAPTTTATQQMGGTITATPCGGSAGGGMDAGNGLLVHAEGFAAASAIYVWINDGLAASATFAGTYDHGFTFDTTAGFTYLVYVFAGDGDGSITASAQGASPACSEASTTTPTPATTTPPATIAPKAPGSLPKTGNGGVPVEVGLGLLALVLGGGLLRVRKTRPPRP